MTHKPAAELQDIIDTAKGSIALWSQRVHYKHPHSDQSYLIKDIAIDKHSFAAIIIYECLYGDAQGILFTRTIKNFLEIINTSEGPVSRFSRLSEE